MPPLLSALHLAQLQTSLAGLRSGRLMRDGVLVRAMNMAALFKARQLPSD
jgi:hypothetical protein